MNKRLVRMLSLILTLVMFLSLATQAYAWGPGDVGSGWDRDIGEDEIRDPDFDPVEEVEEYDYFQALDEENNVQVTIEAPMGSLPSLAEVHLEPVPAEDLREAVDAMVEGNPQILVAMDISFWLGEDEIEPEEPVRVKISAPELEGRSNLQVIHFPDDSEEPETVELIPEEDLTFALGTNEVAFEASSFSVYAVVGINEYARATVYFYNGTTMIDSMIVKEGDTREELNQILYDPGAGTVPEGKMFVGWSQAQNYTVTSPRLTIDGVRDYIHGQTIVDGTEYKFYAMIFDAWTFNYMDETGEISVGAKSIPVAANQTEPVDFTIQQGYSSSSSTHTFLGWAVLASEISKIQSATYEGADVKTKTPVKIGDQDAYLYENGTEIKALGSLVFYAYAPEGHWLVFEQNGSGATYCAPKFIKLGETTARPRPDADMYRYGYTFDGWYVLKAGQEIADSDKDANGNINFNNTETMNKFEAFVFGGEIEKNTTVYAKWSSQSTAPYTILIWQQNDTRTGYTFTSSYSGTGTVGQPIGGFSVADNGDEDYYKITGEADEKYHYTGFTVKRNTDGQLVDKDNKLLDPPVVVPEGSAVLNLYYDRVEYDLKFYYYRVSSGGQISCAYNSNAGQNVWGLVDWRNYDNPPVLSGALAGKDQSETVDGYTGHYFAIHAYYGQDISGDWPKYSDLGTAGNRQPVSFVMMIGTSLKPSATNTGTGTVKGIMTVLDKRLLGKTNDSQGNFLIVRYPDTSYNWRYHIFFETVEGGEFVEQTQEPINSPVIVRSSNTDFLQQNAPQFPGFQVLGNGNNEASGLSYYGGTTTEGGTTLYHAYYKYTRNKATILYMDGVYVDGDNKVLAAQHGTLHTSDPIMQGAEIPDADKNYVPTLPQGKEGFVFEGWYMDEACTQKYTFTTMPVDGITVYAKWRQIQYRLFLVSNAVVDGKRDQSLDWGSDSQQMNFRISYGTKASLPEGTRDDYEYRGWYLDEACTQLYSANAYILNDQTVPTDPAYNKETDFTDGLSKTEVDDEGHPKEVAMDKWGLIPDDANGINKDATKNRFWITRKLVLYCDWRAKIPGAKGIDVVYDLGELGAGEAPVDNNQYLDKSDAVAKPAPQPKNPQEYIFRYWVVQRWDESKNEFVDTDVTRNAGDTFQVLKANAHMTDVVYSETDPTEIVSAKYTVRVRAEFVKLGNAEPTHITWYSNIYDAAGNPLADPQGSTTVSAPEGYVALTYDAEKGYGLDKKEVPINAGIDIPPADTFVYPGYTFLGWGRIDVEETAPEEPEEPKPDALTRDYYLIGWINDQACGDQTDWQNTGPYKICKETGMLTVTFNTRSYCGVKAGTGPDDYEWYWAPTEFGNVTGTSADLYKGDGNSKEFEIPGGVELTFTLTEIKEGDNITGVHLEYVVGDGTTSGSAALRGPSGITDPKDLSDENLFLRWVPGENGQAGHYEAKKSDTNSADRGEGDEDEWVTVTQVAADEKRPYNDMYAIWGGEFQVYHSGIEGGAVETYQITRANKTLDLTRYYTEPKRDETDPHAGEYKGSGFLYGGYYMTDGVTIPDGYDWDDIREAGTEPDTLPIDGGEQPDYIPAYDGANWTWNTPVTKTPGNAITPEPGKMYVIKEVPASKYLQPYFHYTYDIKNGDLATAWLISDFDDSMYRSTGFIIVTDEHQALVTSQLTITNSNPKGSTVVLTPQSVFRSKGVAGGYLSYLKVINNDEEDPVSLLNTGEKVYQYWVTPDNLIVTSTVARSYAKLDNKANLTASSVTVLNVSSQILADFDSFSVS